MRLLSAIVLLVIAQGLGGCRSSSVPPSPSPVSRADDRASEVVDPVPQGSVMDTAFRRIAGVRIEVVDGPQAGAAMISDATGQFLLTGAFVRTNTFRAVKEGYVTATQGFSTSIPSGRPWLYFYLQPVAPPVNIAGDYTLTFVADRACAGLPSDLLTRTYAATIRGANPASPANTSFELTVSGAPLLEKFSSFTIGVAGDSLGFWLHGGHDPPLVEQLAPNTYLAYSGSATATVKTSLVSTISTPFEGWIERCVLRSAMVAPYNCGTSNWTGGLIPVMALEYAHCESKDHQLILTRR